MLQPHDTSVWFYNVSPSVRHKCYFHTSFVTAWLMSDITKHSPPLLLSHSTPSPLQHQGPPSPDPAARHSPYRCHSSESLDYLSGLMPKTLSPTPYVPIGAGGTAGAVGGPSLAAVSGAGISGCASPSASPVTVSALSHYSSSTAGLLDELQICSLDSPGASPTPSPTLSHVSTYTSTAGLDDVLTATAASTAAATFTNVIIPSICCHNTSLPNPRVSALVRLIWMTLTKCCNYRFFFFFYLSLTPNYNPPVRYRNYIQLTCVPLLCQCLKLCQLVPVCVSLFSTVFVQSNAFILSLKGWFKYKIHDQTKPFFTVVER